VGERGVLVGGAGQAGAGGRAAGDPAARAGGAGSF
jgi:hypothetical protein